eukprot:1148295-Rhodomonas_salina.2
MVRPVATERDMDFVVLYMKALTVEEPGKPTHHTVGRRSAFDVMAGCYPHLSRENTRRGGVSPFDMTKALRKAEFPTVKMRSSSFAKRFTNVEPTPANCHRYANRRWRNPDDPEDLAHIRDVLPRLNRAIQFDCSLENCLVALRHAFTITDHNVKRRELAHPSLPGAESVVGDHRPSNQRDFSPACTSPTSSSDATSSCDGNVKHSNAPRPSLTHTKSVMGHHRLCNQRDFSPACTSPTSSNDANSSWGGASACTSPHSSCDGDGLALRAKHVQHARQREPSIQAPTQNRGAAWDMSRYCNDALTLYFQCILRIHNDARP